VNNDCGTVKSLDVVIEYDTCGAVNYYSFLHARLRKMVFFYRRLHCRGPEVGYEERSLREHITKLVDVSF
jgi:hypothetical protein